ncbi:hypothetical protein ACUN6D_26760, partial [Serratia sp. IR-2025]
SAALPDYMVPSAWVVVAALPLSPNGKLDRRALPEPQGAQSQAAYEAPQGEHETLLAGIWRELLNVEQVGRHDNFFELGGPLAAGGASDQPSAAGGMAAAVADPVRQPDAVGVGAATAENR